MKKKNSEILYELALKTAMQQNSIENLLSESSLKSILQEEIENKDIEDLRSAVDSSLKAVAANIKIAQDSGLSSVSDYFQKIKSSLDKANDLVRTLDLSDDSGMLGKLKGFFGSKVSVPRAMQSVINLQNQANTAAKTMGGAFDLITRNLKSLEISDDTVLGTLEKDKNGVDAEQLKTAISKAFNASKPKGFMAKIGSFLGKMKLADIPGAEDVGDLPAEKVAEEILQMKWSDFKSMGDTVTKTADVAESSNVPTSAIKSVSAAASEESKSSAKPGEEKSEKEGESSDKESGDSKEGGEQASDDSAASPEESDPAKEIKAVAATASSTPMSPKDAISKALSDWESSLSDSSQKTLKSKNRGAGLKDAIFTGIDKGKAAVEKAVAKAVKNWRAEHEETLIKSKRFAKKNFDSLEQLIPQLASQVLAQTRESNKRKITTVEIRKFVNKELDSKFDTSNKLYETWQKNAGLLKE